MDDQPERAPKSDLAAALRRARAEHAERAHAIAELREIEMTRLALLESELEPLLLQAPAGVDLFDLALSPDEHPRLFLDMVAFVEMGRDRRTYRFLQDTMRGRVLVAESPQIERIVAAVTNYVARRLVERERALAAEPGDDAPQRAVWPASPVGPAGEAASPSQRPSEAKEEARTPILGETAAPVKRLQDKIGDAFAFVLMTLGSVTLICLLGLGGYIAWSLWLRALWAHGFGLPPF